MFQRKQFDFWIMIPALVLSLAGVIIIFSVSPENTTSHLVYLTIGIVLFFIVFYLDREILYSLNNYLYVLAVVGLLLPFLFGTITRGSVRWIDLGLFTIQPSEIAKPILAIFSAVYLGRKTDFSWRRLICYLGFTAGIVFLILVQPDLGSALVVVSGVLAAVLFSKIKAKHLLLLLLIAILSLPIGWLSLHDYQKDRVRTFINPYKDPLGAGYNAIQAQIAVGSGGLLGRGIGRGTQSHLAFLPERHTDFIFASYAEETGFIGSLLLIILYSILSFRAIQILNRINSPPDKILLSTLSVMLFFQTMINIGMNIGIMPIAGVTLPLVSYGGSSLISTMICLATISNISVGVRNDSFIQVR